MENKTLVWGIESENLFDFIKKMNEFNRDHFVVATQTHIQNKFYAIIYYREK